MKVTDLEYLRELVRRDGDYRLQQEHGVSPFRLHDELGKIIKDCKIAEMDWNVPVIPVMRIEWR